MRTRIRRHSSQRSTSSSARGADRLQVGRVELEPAALAAALVQRGRTDAAAGGADLLVERDQVGRPTPATMSARRRADAGASVVELGAAPGRGRRSTLGDRAASARPAAPRSSATRPRPSSARSMTSSSTSSRSALAAGQRVELVLQGLRSLCGALTRSRGGPGRARRAARTSSTSPSALASSRSMSVCSVSATHELVAELAEPLLELGELGVLGQRARRCAIWSIRVSRACTSSRRSWRRGRLSGRSSSGCGTTHESTGRCAVVETRASTVVAALAERGHDPVARSRPARPLAGPVTDVDEARRAAAAPRAPPAPGGGAGRR